TGVQTCALLIYRTSSPRGWTTPRTEGSSGSGSDREPCFRIDHPAAGHVRAVMVGTAGHYLVAFLGCSVRTHQAGRTGSAGLTVVHLFNSEKVVTFISVVLMEEVMVARVSVLGEAPEVEPDAEDRSAA